MCTYLVEKCPFFAFLNNLPFHLNTHFQHYALPVEKQESFVAPLAHIHTIASNSIGQDMPLQCLCECVSLCECQGVIAVVEMPFLCSGTTYLNSS